MGLRFGLEIKGVFNWRNGDERRKWSGDGRTQKLSRSFEGFKKAFIGFNRAFNALTKL
jgi:hypothetical protein